MHKYINQCVNGVVLGVRDCLAELFYTINCEPKLFTCFKEFVDKFEHFKKIQFLNVFFTGIKTLIIYCQAF
jgi:hypothetical protein